MWLPSLKGLVVVDPARLPGTAEPPHVFIEEAVVNGKHARPEEGVVVPPGSDPLSVRYVAGTLQYADRVRFRYRVEGVTPNWVDAGRSREVTFPALPHGRHLFRVAATIDGQRPT